MKSSPKTQEDLFFETEGTAWYRRNRAAVNDPSREKTDFPLQIMKKHRLKPKRVLEIGCCNGWRLDFIRKGYRCECVGIEPSSAAVAEGRRTRPGVVFKRGVSSALPLPSGTQFDLVIVNFVFHWMARERLLASVAEADRVLAEGGHLIVGDFLPDEPVKNGYHHLPAGSAFTYKQDYAAVFLASGLYRLVGREVFDHDGTTRPGSKIDPDQRGMCTLLEKSLDRFYAAGRR